MPKRPQKKSGNQEMPAEPEIPADHPDAQPEPGDVGLQAIAALEKHKKTVVIATLVVAGAICVGMIGRQIQNQKNIAAAEAYSEAASERSIEKLDAVADQYSGKAAGGNALLTKAEIQLSLDQTEDARITLLKFVEGYKKHARYVQGLFSLGSIHHDTGDAAKAAEYYEKALAAGPDSDIGPLIVIRQGDLALEAADQLQKDGKTAEAEAKKDEARALYEDSLNRKNFRATPFAPLTIAKLDLLAIGEVPVVPAPPEPEPEAKPEAKTGAGPSTPIPAPNPGAGTVLAPKAPTAPAQKADAPKPKGDAPKPKGDTPKPKADAPKPKADAPKPKADAPKPKADAPKPKADAPKPKADAPKPEADAPKPKADAPKPKADAPKPKADAPKPKADTPKPKADAPKPTPDAPKPE